MHYGASTYAPALPNLPRPSTRVAPLRFGDLEIDALHQQVHQGRRQIHLSRTEHLILYALASRAGAIVSYRDVEDVLAHTTAEIRTNNIARHVYSLRRKLGDSARRPQYIETIDGVGYRLVPAKPLRIA